MSNIKLAKPAQGERVILDGYSGKVLELSFPTDSATFARSGQDLHIGFADDSSITLPHFYTIYSENALPTVATGGVITRGTLFFDAQTDNLMPRPAEVDTGGRFILLPEAELMEGTDSLGQIESPALDDPLNFMRPDTDPSPLHAAPLFPGQPDASLPDPHDNLLAFASDDALFGGNDDDILIGAPGDHLLDAEADKVYGDNPEDTVLYDADDTFFTSGPGIDFLIQKTDDIPDSLDSLLPENSKDVDVLVRVDDNMDITNMTDLAHLGLTVENDTLIFSAQWTRDGNVFTNADHTAIVEVNAAENDIQANTVRIALENSN